VAFTVETTLDRAIRCNCSLCRRKGMLYHRVDPADFQLLTPEAEVALYRFGSGVARHHFCPRCGIHTHSRPKAAPHMVSVNVNCLEVDDATLAALTLIDFDGRGDGDAAVLNAQVKS
jgi:hypothetical protein